MLNIQSRSGQILVLAAALLFGVFATPVFAQQYPPQQAPPYPQQPDPQQYPAQTPYPQAPPPYYGQPPAFAPEQLDSMVSRIALYPDPLLAQVLTAATFPEQIPAAASWAMAHSYLTGDPLARAMMDDRLSWDPSVMALIPVPTVLDMMARDEGWTQQLGSAVLAQRPQVMDAVQRMRQRALDYGYLRTTPEQRVVVMGPGAIQIVPAQTGYYYVPVYSPGVVFARPARGISVGISFGPRLFIGAAFSPWGWGSPLMDWRSHAIIIDRHPWERGWVNRREYVHPYIAPPRRVQGPRVERHEEHLRQQEHHERDHHER